MPQMLQTPGDMFSHIPKEGPATSADHAKSMVQSELCHKSSSPTLYKAVLDKMKNIIEILK